MLAAPIRFLTISPRLFFVATLSFLLLGSGTLAQDTKPSQAASAASFEQAFLQDHERSLEQGLQDFLTPGLSIAVIQNGQLAWAKGYGRISVDRPEPVTPETVFSVGSISKVATAVMTLRLVAAGKLDLDKDLNHYVTRWQVPSSSFTSQQPATLRHVMSHTAGFTVHGFRDFQPGEVLPDTVEILLGKHPAKNAPVIIDFEPGSQFRYSGGGTTVQQLILEEQTGLDFPSAAKKLVFQPLGMSRSTFANPLPESHGNIARAHNFFGKPAALPRGWEAMPEMAASGLWTTSGDLAKLLIALMETHQGKRSDFLPSALVQDMMTPVKPARVGLGPFLYSEHLFGHGGSNNSYKAQMVAHLETGNGLVILTNSATGKRIMKDLVHTMRRLESWDWK